MQENYDKIPFLMEQIKPAEFPPHVVRALEYRTASDDKHAIQKAVNVCKDMGGGTVLVEEGNWITGPIHLANDIHLKLEEGTVIRFSEEASDYLPVVFTRWEGIECYNYSPLIYANECENIAITGKGKLYGGGEAWWHWKGVQQEAANDLCYAQHRGIEVKKRVYGTKEAALRPSFIQFINCKGVELKDFTIIDGPQWMLHPVYCENVAVKGVSVLSKGHNTDGLNPDSCKNVLIEDCYFNTGDDCIAINSGMNEDGWRVGKPCENIVIRNCTMNGGHGGIVIGSGMSGGVHNVYAYDCKIKGTNQGIRLKSMRGRGGYVKDVWFENIEINNVSEEAVQINMFYPYSTVIPKTEEPSDFSDIHLKNIYGQGAKNALEICGLPEHELRNIFLEDIDLSAKIPMVCDNVTNIRVKNVCLQGEKEQKNRADS
ncbi:glycoside hydrolase family 28 protein [Konateibacter massiliensis]|uniref:glycoside hydrolase family 28 protein n=1 Tax=Konateibacter massiliensis TaxID=2002841 RepID=UPI000C157D8F|nr:glycoside hydrolase family 28 protein [Konateibacter massiliensis]